MHRHRAARRPRKQRSTHPQGECEPTPTETAGPYPGDGSNGPDILAEDGVVHADLTSSIGSASGKAEGVPLTIKLKLVDNANSYAAMSGSAAVYLWHANAAGKYLDVFDCYRIETPSRR